MILPCLHVYRSGWGGVNDERSMQPTLPAPRNSINFLFQTDRGNESLMNSLNYHSWVYLM